MDIGVTSKSWTSFNNHGDIASAPAALSERSLANLPLHYVISNCAVGHSLFVYIFTYTLNILYVLERY